MTVLNGITPDIKYKDKIYDRMVDPWRVEAECKNCGKEYKLEPDDFGDFGKDVLAGLADAVIEYHKLSPGQAADKVEERMQKYHNLVKKEDGLYCEDCA